MKKRKIKPCPYCGGEIEFKPGFMSTVTFGEHEIDIKFLPICKKCKTIYPEYSIKKYLEEFAEIVKQRMYNEWEVK